MARHEKKVGKKRTPLPFFVQEASVCKPFTWHPSKFKHDPFHMVHQEQLFHSGKQTVEARLPSTVVVFIKDQIGFTMPSHCGSTPT